jgi:hypothetical protein
MNSCIEKEGTSNAGCLLCSVNLVTEDHGVARVPRVEMDIDRFLFRALIAQAVNLPITDSAGHTDSSVVIFFGPAMMSTPVYAGSICPSWYHILEAEVNVPVNTEMRPDIVLYIMDKNEVEENASPLASLRYDTWSPAALPSYWTGPLRWCNLQQAPGGPMTQAKLLCGFELLPMDEVKTHPRTSILPPLVQYRIELFIIGVRIFDGREVRSPTLEVAWGRSGTEENDVFLHPKKNRFTKTGVGANGCFNFLEKVVLSPCSLANDSNYQEWLEVKLIVEKKEDENNPSGDNGEMLEVCCSSVIHLTPYLPFVGSKQKPQLSERYRMKRVSEVNRVEVEAGMGFLAIDELGDGPVMADIDTRGSTVGFPPVDAEKAQKAIDMKEEELARLMKWDVESLEASNLKVIGKTEYSCVSKMAKDHFKQTEAEAMKKDDAEHSDEDEQRGTPAWVRKQFQRTFHWPKLIDTDDDGLGDHKDINQMLERTDDLPEGDLAYHRADLFRQGDGGTAEVIGSLKYLIHIVDRNEYKEDTAEAKKGIAKFEAKCEKLIQDYAEAKDLVIRIYILSAEGLSPQASDSQLTSYVWSTVAGDEKSSTYDPSFSFKDQSTVRSHTVFPDFNVVHKYTKSSFPEHSQLTVKVVERCTNFAVGKQDEVVGSTMIDLENRFFHPNYKKMVKDEVTPVEARPLFAVGSSFGRGHVRLWIDILHHSDEQTLGPKKLPSTEAVDYQLRIVAWKLYDISNCDDSNPAHSRVRMWMTLDTGEQVMRETDDHKDTQDRMATFNYRMIFPIKVPCQKNVLAIQVRDEGVLASSVIGGVALDLERDLAQGQRTGAEVVLPLGKVKIMHADAPGVVRGVLEMQGILLHGFEAKMRVQGEGQEEPNEDPWLNPNDSHRLKGRASVLAHIGSVVMSAGGALWTMGKYAMMIKIAMVAGGFLMTGITGITLVLMSSSK